MRKLLVVLAAAVLLWPAAAAGQGASPATLDAVAKALGADGLRSIQVSGTGSIFATGQSPAPGAAWPRFVLKSYTRGINFETASAHEDLVRARADDPPRGGGLPAVGELRQVLVVSGDHAWNVAGQNVVPAPIALAERQFQLWATPHGIVKAAAARNATIQGRTIAFAVPGRFTLKATVDDANLIQKVEAKVAHPVVGDLPVEIAYGDYKDFGGVKVPMRVRQSAGGHPSLDFTVTDVRPNAPVDVQVPDAVRQATNPYARVTSQMAAEGVWYLTGGSHHSVVIEMKDHLIVVEAPLNDERALAVLAEARKLSSKPVRYVVNSHHHYDHSGGVRAFAAEGVTIITHEVNRPFFERVLTLSATVNPDHFARSGRRAPTVEGVRFQREIDDGTRAVRILQIAGNPHHDGLLMVYLPREKFLIQADAYTPAPPNTPPPSIINPFSVNLAENIERLGLVVDQLLPLHGRMVPLAELHRAIGRGR
jgi:glyoxylase-like metal-dependent hydrolase (beta-lactamase superfamily II)